MDTGRTFDRLRLSVMLLWVLVAIVACVWGVRSLLSNTDEVLHTLHCTTDLSTDQVHLSASSDGPFVVFGLASYGESAPEKRWAAFPVPLTIIDSAGAWVSVRDLKWVDFQGQPSAPPTSRRFIALYIRPQSTESAQP